MLSDRYRPAGKRHKRKGHTEATKAKIDKWDYIKLKSYIAKETIKSAKAGGWLGGSGG